MVTVAELDALIRVRVEGEQNARQVQKALDSVEKSAGDLSQAFKNVDKAATGTGLRNAEKAFTSAGNAAERAAREIASSGAATQKTAGQFTQAGGAAQRTGNQFKQTADASQSLSRSLGTIDDQAKSAASGLNTSAKSAQSADSTFSSLTKTAAGIGAGFVGGAAALNIFQGAVKASIGSALTLEKSVANISTIKPEIDTSAVTASILDMSTRVAQSSDQLADSLYNIFSSIEISQEDALRLTEKFARGAVAAQTDAETFGTAVLGVMNAYRLSVEDADHISDIFFNTINKGVITGQELAASLGPVTQSAKAAGVPLETLGAMIAAVTKEGGEAAQNVNNLNNLFQKITTNDAQAELNKLGVATSDATGNFRPMNEVLGDLRTRLQGMTEAAQLSAIQKIFPDAQARQGAQTIISQLDMVNEAIEVNKTQAGSAGKAYDTMASTGAANTQILLNNLSKIGTEAANKALPAINDLTTGMVDLIEVMGKGQGEDKGGWVEFFGRSLEGAFKRFIIPAQAGLKVLDETGDAGSAAADRLDGTAKKVYDLNAANLAAVPATQGQVDALRLQAQAAQDARVGTEGFNLATVGMVEVTGPAIDSQENLARVLGMTEDEFKKVKDVTKEATDRIKEYADAATPMTQAAGVQSAALKGVVSQAEAMVAVPLSPQMQEWAQRAHELADASGTTGKPLDDLHGTIDRIAGAGPGAAGAIEGLKKQVEGIEKPTLAAAQADRDYLAAQGTMQEAMLKVPQTIGELVSAMNNFVRDFQIATGRIPAAMKEAVRLTEEAVTIDLSKPGAELAISLANGFGRETIRIVDGAGNVIREVKGTLNAADMSPEGVAFMQKVAKGVTEGGLTVQESARKVLEDAGIGMNTEAGIAVTNTNTTLGTTAQGVDIKPNIDVMAGVIDPAMKLHAGAAKDNANTLLGEVADGPTRANVKRNADFAGTDFSQGWKNGVESIDIVSHARGIFNDAVSAVERVLGIRSPSTVMHQAGVNFMQGFLDGTGSLAGELTAKMTSLAQGAFDKFKSTLGGAFGAAGDFVGGLLPGGGGASGEVTGWLQQAMAITGVGADWLAGLQELVRLESGGDPNARNPHAVIQNGINYGHATGLLQTIPGTFAAHNTTGGSITDPIANAVAAINYIRARYGHVNNAVRGHRERGGFASGTNHPIKSGSGWVGEEGPELFNLGPEGLSIFSNAQSKAMMGGRLPGFQGGTVGSVDDLIDEIRAIMRMLPRELLNAVDALTIMSPDEMRRLFGFENAQGVALETAPGRGTINFSTALIGEAEEWVRHVIAHEFGHLQGSRAGGDWSEETAIRNATNLGFPFIPGAGFNPDMDFGRIVAQFTDLVAMIEPLQALPPTLAELPPIIGQIDASMTEAANAALSFGDNTATLPASLEDGKAAIERISDQIDLLNHELAFTDPYSDRAAAIKSEIGILQAWQGQIQSGIKVLENQQGALLKSTTALEGATGAWSEMQRAMQMAGQFGTGAGPIDALMQAISANTPEAGAAAVQSLQQFIAGLSEQLGPQAQETGNYLRFLMFEALNPANADSREMLLGRFSEVFAEIQAQNQAAATLSGETYASAYSTALTQANLAERVGPTFTQFFDLLAQQAKEGSAQTIASIGAMSVDIEREIGRLPDLLKGPLLQEWRAAWATFLESGDISRLESVAADANRALTLIPEGFIDAAPELQQAILDIIASMDELGLSSEEAAKRIGQATKGAAEGAAREAERLKAVEDNRVADLKASGQAISQQQVAQAVTAQLRGSGGGSGGSNSQAMAAASFVAGGRSGAEISAMIAAQQQIADYQAQQNEELIAGVKRVDDSIGNFMNIVMHQGMGINSPGVSGEGTIGRIGGMDPAIEQLHDLLREARNRMLEGPAYAILQRRQNAEISLAEAIEQLIALLGGGGGEGRHGFFDYAQFETAVANGVARGNAKSPVQVSASAITSASIDGMTNTARRTI